MATTAEDLQKLSCNLVLQKLNDPQLKCHDLIMFCFLTFGRRAAGNMHSIPSKNVRDEVFWNRTRNKKGELQLLISSVENVLTGMFDFHWMWLKMKKKHKTENDQMNHNYKRVTQRTIAKIFLLLKVSMQLPKTTFMKQQLKLPAGQKCCLSRSTSLENGMLGNLPNVCICRWHELKNMLHLALN